MLRFFFNEEQTMMNFSDFSRIHTILKKLVAIHFHPSHLQPNIINTSFCAQVGLLLTKLNHYFNDSIDTNVFRLFTLTPKIGDATPLNLHTKMCANPVNNKNLNLHKKPKKLRILVVVITR